MAGYLTLICAVAALLGSVCAQSSQSSTESVGRCMTQMKFYLHTKTHPERYYLELDKIEESIRNSTIDFKKQTKFISYPHDLHRTDLNFTEIIQKIVNKLDSNVIVIEWPLVSKRSPSQMEIFSSQSLFEGGCIARLLNRLGRMEVVDPTKFHLIAFGEKVPVFVLAAKLSRPYDVGRLTGLEPVYDNITITFLELNTTKELGMNFVDMIYTGLLPSQETVNFGHASFYPNGGLHPQPGVPESSRDVSSIRGLRYFVESIDKPDAFVAKKCDSWAQFVAQKCSNSETSKLGEYTSTRARGKFYLTTIDKAPYGLA